MNSAPVVTALHPDLTRLTHLVADHGIRSFESDIARLVVRLRASGMQDRLIGLLGDRTAAPVVRERALGVLASRFLDGTSRPSARTISGRSSHQLPAA
jgi:hypothetical protein